MMRFESHLGNHDRLELADRASTRGVGGWDLRCGNGVVVPGLRADGRCIYLHHEARDQLLRRRMVSHHLTLSSTCSLRNMLNPLQEGGVVTDVGYVSDVHLETDIPHKSWISLLIVRWRATPATCCRPREKGYLAAQTTSAASLVRPPYICVRVQPAAGGPQPRAVFEGGNVHASVSVVHWICATVQAAHGQLM